MMETNTYKPANKRDIENFVQEAPVELANDFIEFYSRSNGAEISSTHSYLSIWPINELIQLNEAYGVDEFAPDFFIFGSDGGDTAYVIQKSSGRIFEVPFVGMANEKAIFVASSFNEFFEMKSQQ